MKQQTTGEIKDGLDKIKQDYFSCRLKSNQRQGKEILFFSKKCTFLYPYKYWNADEDISKRNYRFLECMGDNYLSFLNVILSVTKLLKYLSPDQISKVRNISHDADDRLDQVFYSLLKAFPDHHDKAFPDQSGNASSSYFTHALEPIGKYLHLDDSLNRINLSQ
jgi:hypothetical protein